MNPVHVTVGYRHWKGSSQVEKSESSIIVIDSLEINGCWVDDRWADLSLQGFATISLRQIEDAPGYSEIKEQNDKDYALLREQFTDPDDYLEGTDEDVLVLPVSTIEWVELAPYLYLDPVA